LGDAKRDCSTPLITHGFQRRTYKELTQVQKSTLHFPFKMFWLYGIMISSA